MIRRSFLSLLFAVLLVFAQQEAMLHPYEHAADWQQKSSSNKQTPPHSETCGKCLALADINSAVGSKSQALQVVPGQFELSSTLLQSIVSAHFLPYHSRAPPYLA
jgi:hypothetical protein